MRKRSAFTLIELLMAVSLTALIGAAVYSNLSSGIKMMRKTGQVIREEDINIFLEKWTREIQNSFPYSSILFQGDEEQCSFPSVIMTNKTLGADNGIGRVTYFFDAGHRRIGRHQENVSDLFEENSNKAQAVMERITEMRFSYFGYQESESRYVWFDEWDPAAQEGRMPMAVRMQLQYKDEDKTKLLTKTIHIPAGG